MLRADDQRPAGQLLPRQVHPPLQLACGHDAWRPVSGDQARGSRPLPAAGRQQHRPGVHSLHPGRAGQGQPMRAAVTGQGAAAARAAPPGPTGPSRPVTVVPSRMSAPAAAAAAAYQRA